MDDRDEKEELTPVILIRDRRSHRQEELDATQVMSILRKRGAKDAEKKEPGDSDTSG